MDVRKRSLLIAQSYEENLSAIALLRVVDSKSMNHLFSDSAARGKFIMKALERKHIRKIAIKERIHRERKSKTLIAITIAGLQYLAQMGDELFDMACNQMDMSVFTGRENKVENKLRLTAVTGAILLSNRAGAIIPTECFGSLEGSTKNDEDEIDQKQKYSLKDFYRDYLAEDAYERYAMYHQYEPTDGSEYYTFYTRENVKQMVAHNSARTEIGKESAVDYYSGRYAGIVDSRYKCLLLYMAPLYTMPWSRWLSQAEVNAYSMWSRTFSRTPSVAQSSNGTTAALIVSNEREFAYHYLSKNRTRDRGEVFGGTFRHLYILPNDQTGAIHLNWLMTMDDNDMLSELKESAVSSGEFREQDESQRSSPSFCLVDANGTETAILLTMDAKQINEVRYYAEEEQRVIKVLCFEWQHGYLKRVLPDSVQYRILPNMQ